VQIKSYILGLSHEIIVKKPLTLWQPAHDNVLVFLWHLLLNVLLQPPQQERSQNL